MKKIAAALLIVAGLAGFAAAAETEKIGLVDIGEIARNSAAGKAAVASLEKKTAQYKESFKAKEKELDKFKQAAVAKAAGMTPAQRAAKEKEFAKKVADYQKYMKDAREEMMKKESELTGKIVTDIEAAATDYGKKNGYVLVVKKEGLIMAQEKYEQKDITAEIMKAFDAKK